MNVRYARQLWIALALVFTAVTAGDLTAQAKASRANPHQITLEEIQAARQSDAFLLVQSLRPQWLRIRGAASMSRRESVKIYQDGVLMGGPEALRQIPTGMITSLRYLNGMVASQQYGTDHGNGAIVIRTGRG